MAGNLQERIEFNLAYNTTGKEDIDEMAESQDRLADSGDRANQTIQEGTEDTERLGTAETEASEAARQLSEQEMALASSMMQTNEIVRQATIELEFLKFQLEEGQITQNQYEQGIDSIRNTLEGLDTQSTSSVRALRLIAQEQRATDGILESLIGTTDSYIGKLIGSAGMFAAVGTVTTAVIYATEQFSKWHNELLDGEAIASGYSEIVNEMISSLQELQGLDMDAPFNTQSLEEQLDLQERILETNENELRVLQNQANFLVAGNFQNERTIEQKERLDLVLTLIEAREENIVNANERVLQIKGEILTNELLMQDEVTRNLIFEEQRAEAIEASRDAAEELTEELRSQRETEIQRIAEGIENPWDAYINRGQEFLDWMVDMRAELDATSQFLSNFNTLLRDVPEMDRDVDPREERDIENAALQQQLAEQARLAVIRDSVTEEEFIRQSMESRFYQERLDLIRQGFSDERDLFAAMADLRVIQEQELQDELARIDQEEAAARMGIWQQFSSSLQGLGEALVGSSDEAARQAFAINKALAMAQATAFGFVAIIRAWGDLGPLAGSAMIGSVAAQLAKLAATRYTGAAGGSTARTRPEITFRGIQAETVQGTANVDREFPEFPNTLYLRDRSGNFLTELELARDKEGGTPYVGTR